MHWSTASPKIARDGIDHATGDFFLGMGSLTVQGSAADKITLSSTHPTAFDSDFVVAQEQGFGAKENLGVGAIYRIPDLVLKALIAGAVNLARSALTSA